MQIKEFSALAKSKATKKNIFRVAVIAAAIFITIIAVMLFSAYLRENRFIKKHDQYITQLCAEYGVDKNLVYAIIKAESGFKANSVSHKGAIGLMQLMPQTAEYMAEKNGDTDYTLQNLALPQYNLRYGISYIGYLQSKFSHSDAVIAAYNAGEGNVRKWLSPGGKLAPSSIPFKETRDYLKKVNAFHKGYINKFGY